MNIGTIFFESNIYQQTELLPAPTLFCWSSPQKPRGDIMESGPIEQRPGNKVIGGFAAATCERALGFAWQHCGRNHQKSTVIIAAAHGFRARRTNHNISIPSISYTFIRHYRKHVSAQPPASQDEIAFSGTRLAMAALSCAFRDLKHCVHHDEGPSWAWWFQVCHSSWRLHHWHHLTPLSWSVVFPDFFLVSINFSVIGPLYKLLFEVFIIGNVSTLKLWWIRMLVRDAAVLSEAKCF